MSPLQLYQSALATGNYEKDPAQENAMQQLEVLYQQIQSTHRQRYLPTFLKKTFPQQGVYLYGDVGAGKTWMMDMFYTALTVKKMRLHFHQFMREIHRELKILQGRKNPLQRIAQHLAHRACVICFDELFVNDIGDAMILSELFHGMLAEGIFVVFTSNVPPELLYRHGLQRSRFYPAIQLLNEKMHVVPVKSLKDYRWRHALSEGVYFSPLTSETEGALATLFARLIEGEGIQHEVLQINQRDIPYVCRASDVIWFNFDQLCHVPRSVQDFVSLSKQFKVFIIDQIPIICEKDINSAWYLISLVDVLYDARCRLVLRSAAEPKDLYRGAKLNFEYQRTLSRLQEMQMKDYWN